MPPINATKIAVRAKEGGGVLASPRAALAKVGGSASDDWNGLLANQAFQALWTAHSDPVALQRQHNATVAALVGIGPTDELEGMMAAQLIAAHNAAMECYRRAMLGDQTFDGRRENLTQANKLSRTFASLLEALNRYRGKGQQKVTVEHVHVHSGGQAVVGVVQATGGGAGSKQEDQPHAKQLTHAPQPQVRCENSSARPVPVASDEKRSVPHAWRPRDRSAER